jgi:hypothetical protein
MRMRSLEDAREQASANEKATGVWWHAFYDTSGNACAEPATMPKEFPLMPVCQRCRCRHYLAKESGELITGCPFDTHAEV